MTGTPWPPVGAVARRLTTLTLALAFASALASAASAQVTFDNGCPANTAWDCADNWDTNTVPAAGDDVVIGGFLVTGTFTSASLASLSLANTTLNTDGTMSVGRLDWTSGSINAGAFLTITGTGSVWAGGVRTVNGTTLEVAPGAEVVWNSGNVNLNSGAALVLGGLLTMQNNNALDYASGAAPSFTVESAGTLRKDGAAGTSTIDVETTNSGGTIDAQTGTISFTRSGALEGGTYSATAGAEVRFDSGTFTASGTLSGSPDGLVGHDAGATLTAPAGATLDFGGTGYRWNGGTISAPGAGVLTNAGLLVPTSLSGQSIAGDGTFAGDVVLRNEGTIAWENGAIGLSSRAVVENAGLLDMRSDDTFDYVSGQPPELVNEATGTVRKSVDESGTGSTGTSTLDVFLTNRGGTIDVQNGRLSVTRGGSLEGGTYNAEADRTLLFNTDTYTASGTLTGSPAGFVGHDVGATLTVADGTAATLDFDGAGYQWIGGAVSAPGTGVLTNAGLLAVTGSAAKGLSGDGTFAGDVVLRNEGTVAWDQGNLNLSSRAVIENADLFDIQQGLTLDYVSGQPPEFVNEATGTLRKSGDAFAARTDVPLTNEGGLVEVLSGSLFFQRGGSLQGGTYSAEAGTELRFDAGTFTASGTLSGSPDGLLGHDSGATLTTTAGATLDFGGAGYVASNGSLTAPGAGVLANAGLLTLRLARIDGDGTFAGDVVLRNEGTVAWDAGNVNVSAGAIIENAGLFDARTNGTLDYVSGTEPAFVNEVGGTFQKSAGGGTTTVDVATTNRAGATILADDGVLSFTRGLDNQEDGTLGGTERLNPLGGFGLFANDGVVAPGGAPGVLTFQDGLDQSATAELAVQIAGNGGPGSAGGHDQLEVFNQDAALDGEISVDFLDGFRPEDGDEYVILTANNVSGEFSNPDANDRFFAGDGVAFTVLYESDQVRLVADVLQADLALAKTVEGMSSATVDVGTEVTFEVTLTNNGPDDLFEFGLDENVAVEDALPDGLTLVSASESAGTYDEAADTWTVPSLANGASETLTVVARVDAAGTFANTATITSSDLEDPDGSNDTASATVEGQAADLALTKTASATTVMTGDPFQFVVTLANGGPNDAADVVVADEVPAGLSCTATESAGTYSETDGEWTVPALADGASATLTFDCTASATGTYENTASLDASSPVDPDGSNDEASATVTVTASPDEADLALAKTVSEPTAPVGSQVTFVVTLTNGGPDAASGVEVTDPEPAGFAFVSATPSQGTYDDGTGVWTVGALADGQSETLTVVATVTAEGTQTNAAAVSASDQVDPDAANNVASASVEGQGAPAVACTTGSPLSFDFDGDGSPTTVGPDDFNTVGSDPTFGEFAGLRNGSADVAVDLAPCSFVAFDAFTERVIFALDASGTVAAGDAFVFATTGGDQPFGREDALRDDPGAFALVTGPAAVDDGVGDYAGRVVAAVVYSADPAFYGSIGGDATPAEMRTFAAALAWVFGQAVSTEDGGPVDLAVTAWPNPTRGPATVAFGLAEPGPARVAVFDALGREVAVLADGPFGAGQHEVALDADALPAGAYAVRVSGGAEARGARFTVVR